MALIVLPTTGNTTPDPAQGGDAVTSATNTGHGSTTASQVGAGVETKTCIWTGVGATPGGQITSVILRFDWTEDGTIANDGGSIFRVQYSTNGGGAWTDVFNHTNTAAPASGSSQVTLSTSQDTSQVQVRGLLEATGGDVGDSASVTATVSDIRVEVVTSASAAIVVM